VFADFIPAPSGKLQGETVPAHGDDARYNYRYVFHLRGLLIIIISDSYFPHCIGCQEKGTA
jgi:hypothetical protein